MVTLSSRTLTGSRSGINRKMARRLADEGFLSLAVDLYGSLADSPERARELRVLEEVGANATVHVYPGAGHAFANPFGRNDEAAAAEAAWQRTVEFLHEAVVE